MDIFQKKNKTLTSCFSLLSRDALDCTGVFCDLDLLLVKLLCNPVTIGLSLERVKKKRVSTKADMGRK